jgi:hypothetical protein
MHDFDSVFGLIYRQCHLLFGIDTNRTTRMIENNVAAHDEHPFVIDVTVLSPEHHSHN